MLASAGYPPDNVRNLTINTLFDALSHASTWIATAIGLFLLYRAVRRGHGWSGRRLFGGMLMGWGGFNLVEGLIDHHVIALDCLLGDRKPRTPNSVFANRGAPGDARLAGTTLASRARNALFACLSPLL